MILQNEEDIQIFFSLNIGDIWELIYMYYMYFCCYSFCTGMQAFFIVT